jgi:ribose transport system permease protein
MWRTAVGLGIVATISNAFSVANVNPNYQNIVKGSIIVGALALDVYARRLAGRTRSPSASSVAIAESSPTSVRQEAQ